MNRRLCMAVLAVITMITACTDHGIRAEGEFDFADSQLRYFLTELDEAVAENPDTDRGPAVSPRSVRDGNIFVVSSRDWTSGFFPGMLWLMYEQTGDDFWLNEARNRTAPIEREKDNAGTHDMGFKIYCSFGNGYRLTHDDKYRDVIIASAQTLITRYNEKTGAIRSWDFARDRWQFPVIIDNMMNLELLFRATQLTGDSLYHQIALQHARTSLKHLFRDNNSSYHVADFDTATGEVRNLHTHQGSSHESAWARGQSWGLYGFTMAYRFTDEPDFLSQAEKIAAFILNHPNLPEDMVPYWDFDAPGIPEAARDVSAAAIMASALFELSTMVPQRSDYYRQTAGTITDNISRKYRSQPGENFGFLLHSSTGHLPDGHEIETPIIYADYYYLEALLRKKRL
jgi:unsaturated chondroitin disaccharide hydrolase